MKPPTESEILAQYEQQMLETGQTEAWYKKPLRILGWIAIGIVVLIFLLIFGLAMIGL